MLLCGTSLHVASTFAPGVVVAWSRGWDNHESDVTAHAGTNYIIYTSVDDKRVLHMGTGSVSHQGAQFLFIEKNRPSHCSTELNNTACCLPTQNRNCVPCWLNHT